MSKQSLVRVPLVLFLVLMIILFAIPAVLEAAPSWEPLGPFGGDRFELKISPADRQTLFVYGHRNIHKSIDGGLTWAPVSTAEMNHSNTFLSLVFDPRQSDVIYAGGTATGVWRSFDAGATWGPCSNGIPQVAPNTYVGISSLAFDSAGSLYAGVSELTTPVGVVPARVYRSDDGGDTWSAADEGISVSAQGLTQSVSVLLSVDAEGSVWAAVYGGGVFRLEHGMWVAHNGTLPESALRSTYLAHDPSVPGHMVVGTEDNWIYESFDYGTTWTSVAKPSELRGLAVLPLVYFITFDPSNSGYVVVRTNDSEGSIETPVYRARLDQGAGSGLYVSFDGAKHWYRRPYFVFRLTFDPSTVTDTAIPEVGSVLRSATVYGTSVGSHCVQKSVDGGLTFVTSIEGIDSILVNAVAVWPNPAAPSETLVYGGAESGIYMRQAEGLFWKRQQPVANHLYLWSFAEDFANPGHVFYSTGNPSWSFPDQRGIYRTSTDCLGSMDPVCPPGAQLLAGVGVWRVVTTPAAPLKIYAACQEEGVLVSVDGGETWQSMNAGLTLPISICDLVLDSNGEPLYAARRESDGGSSLASPMWSVMPGESGGLYVFDRQSREWRPVYGIASAVTALDYDFDTGVLLAATAQGIYRTEDGGATWHVSEVEKSFRDIVSDPGVEGLAYAASGIGIYRSFDSGISWAQLNQGLRVLDANQLTVDVNTGIVYAATAGGSVYRLVPAAAPQPQISVSVSSLDFGEVFVGDTEYLQFTVSNLGEDSLLVDGSCEAAEVSLGEGFPLTVPPMGSVHITASFSPSVGGSFADMITLTSNDPMTSLLGLPVTGMGLVRLGPVADIKINGADGPVTISYGTAVRPTVSVLANDYLGLDAEFYVSAETPFGTHWYVMGQGWVKSTAPLAAIACPISDVSSLALGSGKFPRGNYTLQLSIDTVVDGVFTPEYFDMASLTVK
ncbi:MAG: hypothetical protein Kow0099_14350 [Candidatus Abyssubacteria bacterium]